ncbi:hypothetical protein BH18ACT17_BH18ACT17_00030 [soil metagenome]
MNVVSERGATGSPRVRWPWVGFALFLTMAIVGSVLVVVNDESIAEQVPFLIAFGLFGVVGALISSRDRGNRIGLLFLYGSCATAMSYLAGGVTSYRIGEGDTEGPLIVVAALAANLGWVIGITPVLFLLPLLFPTGSPPSPRWRPLLWLIGGFTVVAFIAVAVGADELSGSSERVAIDNPLHIPALAPLGDLPAIGLAAVALLAASVASLVIRFRRSHDVERQQLKWVVFAFVTTLMLLVASELLLAVIPNEGLLDSFISGTAFLILPVAVGIAMLKYRLFDLDVVVRKTLVIGVLAVLIAAVYVAVVAGGTALLGRDDPTLSIGAAVVLALVFQPARAQARRLADRVVYGDRATPYEVLTEFSDRVGDAFATDDVLTRMAQILGRGTGAATAMVWLEAGGELRPAGSYPSDSVHAAPARLADGRMRVLPMAHAVEVRDRGELLGALSVDMPADDPMTPSRDRLVRDLASQAGLVLRNVRLVQDLRESRRRLVAAQDEERRKLERNIHDGAQQQLVALQVRQRLVEQLIERDPTKAKEMVGQLQEDTAAARDDLRDLARGIYPPLLADKGLEAALTAQARKSAVPVEVDAHAIERFSQDIEAAVYFSTLEALQNTAKYAGASRATVTLSRANGSLAFTVSDDGAGFDPSATGYGTGLQGIADRLGALDGELEVTSSPGSGTTVTGRVPVVSGFRNHTEETA